MPLRNIRPLHILWQENIDKEMLSGVFLGIVRILSLAGVLQNFQLKYFVQRRQPNWHRPDGTLAAYQSLDWHIKLARLHSKKAGYLNSTVLLNSLKENPTHQTRYELVVVNEPLHWSDDFLISVNGVGQEGRGAVITLNHHPPFLQPITEETDEGEKKRYFDFLLCTQMLTMHELGHVFGLFSGTGYQDPTDEKIEAMHCPNNCAMHIYREIDLEREIKDRPFCPSCLEKLKQFFIAP